MYNTFGMHLRSELLQLTDFHDKTKRPIFLSGITCSGKTTIGQIVAANLGTQLVPEFSSPIPRWVMNTRKDHSFQRCIEAQQWTLLQHQRKNEHILSSDLTIVDRYWPDTLLYSVLYGDKVFSAVESLLTRYAWISGKYFILYSEDYVIKERLKQKLRLSEQQWLKQWYAFIHDLSQATLELAAMGGFRLIDTSSVSIEDAAAQIIDS